MSKLVLGEAGVVKLRFEISVVLDGRVFCVYFVLSCERDDDGCDRVERRACTCRLRLADAFVAGAAASEVLPVVFDVLL